jgi:hypothetical protein
MLLLGEEEKISQYKSHVQPDPLELEVPYKTGKQLREGRFGGGSEREQSA